MPVLRRETSRLFVDNGLCCVPAALLSGTDDGQARQQRMVNSSHWCFPPTVRICPG